VLKLALDLGEEKKFENTVGFPTSPVQIIFKTMARCVRGKKV